MADRRIIAIAVAPKAYDEIQKLKGKETWTSFVINAVVKLVGGNEILEAELDALPKKAEPKPKVEKPKAEKKAKKGKKAESVEVVFEELPVMETEPTETELEAIEEGLPNEIEG